MHNSRVNWASMVSIPKFVALLVNRIETVRWFQPVQNKPINHMNQPQLNHPVDIIGGTSQSPVIHHEIINSISTQK